MYIDIMVLYNSVIYEIKECKNTEIIKNLIYKLRKFENRFDLEIKSPEEITEKLIEWMNKKLKSPNTFIFIATIENKPIAYIFGYIEKRSKNYWKTNKYGYICDLFVEEEFRGKGIGKALLNKAEKWFKEKGIKVIYIESYAKNPYLDFYEKLRYEKLSVKFYKNI